MSVSVAGASISPEFDAQAVARRASPRTSRDTPAAAARSKSIVDAMAEDGRATDGRTTVGATALADAFAGVGRRPLSVGRPVADPAVTVAAMQTATAPGKTRFSKCEPSKKLGSLEAARGLVAADW
jgi:hypothetical protein